MYKPNMNITIPETKNGIRKKQEKGFTKSCSRHAETSKNTPIEVWWDLIQSDNAQREIEQRLRQVYESNLPTLGEIVFTSSCQFKCQHCLYNIDYGRFNTCLSPEQWKRIIKNVYDDLEIRTFVHCGRSIDDTGIEILKWMRNTFKDIKFGLIDNGISLIPYLEELPAIQPDWIDISIDGMEKEHDLQRKQKGSFKKALGTIMHLKEKHISSKINILICLTKLNKDSIINLIEFMNQKGFKNFFIFPASTFDDYQPLTKLKVSGDEFAKFLQQLHHSLDKFKDTWIEVNLFDIRYLKDIKIYYPELWQRFKPEEEHLSYKMLHRDNEFYINYYPLSLHGIREFTVNSNGDVIFPQVVRKGKLLNEDIIGNLISHNAIEIMEKLRNFKLGYHVNALLLEKSCIGGR